MSLFEVKDKLYKKETEKKDLSKYDKVAFDPRISSVDPQVAGFKKTGDVWGEKQDTIKEERTNAVKIAGIVFASIILIAIIVVGFYFYRKTSFNEERLTVEMIGARDASSGKNLNYEIVINNNNWAKLKDASLKISYPESFVPGENPGFKADGKTGGTIQIGDIRGREIKKIFFVGKAYSPKGTMVYLKTDLLYSPSGFSGQFVSSNQFGLNVVSSPITLSFLAPQTMSNGDALDYLITYKNEGLEDFENIKIKIEYPKGFTFSKAEPNTSEGIDTWYVGNLSPGQSGKIVVSGKLEGGKDEIKTARVYVGEFSDGKFLSHNEEKVETKINYSPIRISQVVEGVTDGVVNAGDVLKFQIAYKNEGTVGLRDVIITEKIDSVALDYAQLYLEKNGGSFDSKNKTIIWKASDVPGLKYLDAGQEGIIEFSIKVKDIISVTSDKDREFVISSVVKIDSPDIPSPIQGNKVISGNKIDMKINSKLFLGVDGFYYDDVIKNSGPIPPKVGQETTYTIKWRVLNTFNNVSGVKVESVLSPGVSMTGNKSPENVNLTFNERTNSIVWEIGNLDAGTGLISAAKEVRFQIKITPSPAQAGNVMDILEPSKITAKDLFTGKDISFTAEKKTSYFKEDPKMSSNTSQVSE